jgi:hypothetical protein
MNRRLVPLTFVFGLLTITLGVAQGAPRLVMMLVVDQMRADYSAERSESDSWYRIRVAIRSTLEKSPDPVVRSAALS